MGYLKKAPASPALFSWAIWGGGRISGWMKVGGPMKLLAELRGMPCGGRKMRQIGKICGLYAYSFSYADLYDTYIHMMLVEKRHHG